MRTFFFILILGIIAANPQAAIGAGDTIAVVDHSIVGFGTQANPSPNSIIITLEIEYVLHSQQNAVLRLAIDEHTEMQFTVVKEQPVTAGKRKQKAQIKFTLEKFNRDILRGMILLSDPAADPQSKPLAATGLSLNVKKFKQG